jgi:hypothetical protein
VFDTISNVMKAVHPCIVTQEQILRSAFIAHLPQNIARQIGTPSSSVHPERPTPGLYQQTGSRKLRARFDLAFGHVENNDGITGVIEIRAGNASFHTHRQTIEIGAKLTSLMLFSGARCCELFRIQLFLQFSHQFRQHFLRVPSDWASRLRPLRCRFTLPSRIVMLVQGRSPYPL